MVVAFKKSSTWKDPLTSTSFISVFVTHGTLDGSASRFATNIQAAITRANVIRDGVFIDMPGRAFVTARTPADTVTRRVEQICPDELATALVNLVNDGGTVSRDDLMTAADAFTGGIVEAPTSPPISRS